MALELIDSQEQLGRTFPRLPAPPSGSTRRARSRASAGQALQLRAQAHQLQARALQLQLQAQALQLRALGSATAGQALQCGLGSATAGCSGECGLGLCNAMARRSRPPFESKLINGTLTIEAELFILTACALLSAGQTLVASERISSNDFSASKALGVAFFSKFTRPAVQNGARVQCATRVGLFLKNLAFLTLGAL